MAGTFVFVRYHLVWSTLNRTPWLDRSLHGRLFAYMGAILKTKGGVLLRAGGTNDHVHLCVSISTSESIAATVNALKANSSRWLHRECGLTDFAWQEGYGVFTVSKSCETQLFRYIDDQEAHHAFHDFGAEFLALLAKHGVEFDARCMRV